MPNSNTLTITGLQAQAIRLPLRKPFRNSSGALTTIPLILTEMKSARGIVGRSIVFAYNDLALKPLAELINNMAPNSPVSAATLEKQLEQRCRLLGLQGSSVWHWRRSILLSGTRWQSATSATL